VNKTVAKTALTLALSAVMFVNGAAQQIKVDKDLPVYQKKTGVSGSLNSVGSDTMNNLLKFWAEAFRKLYPGVTVQVEGKGSSTAPPALVEGVAQLGPMSRELKSSEIDAFEKKYGFKPTTIRTSLDALAIYVNKDNPLDSISFDKLDAIFSVTRKHGHATDITKWGDLELTGAWASGPISLYGRNSASGTYGYFKEHALGKGDFKTQVKEQPGSASVVEGVNGDRFGIGYSGIGYTTSGVKMLKLAEKAGAPAVEPSFENVANGSYPLARYLYITVVKDPNKPLDPLVKEFLTFALSMEGQEIVVKTGYMPITAAVAKKELGKL